MKNKCVAKKYGYIFYLFLKCSTRDFQIYFKRSYLTRHETNPRIYILGTYMYMALLGELKGTVTRCTFSSDSLSTKIESRLKVLKI